jgi:hypothetical protein
MIAGHIGVAAAAKAYDRRIPFWALLIATFLIDIIFAVLWVFGVESMSDLPDTDGGYGNMLFEVDWSHSFFGTLILCLFVLIFTARYWGGKGALVLSGLVFSHWFLDLIVHRNDMPIMPGNIGGVMPRVGLGMWDAPVATMIFEALLVILGAFLWYRTRPAGDPDGSRAATRSAALVLVGGLAVLLIDFLG